MAVTLKEKAFQFCQQSINDRIKRISLQIGEIQKALQSETKSSAGDKHETGRAMIQLEREKLGQQLLEAEKTKQILSKVNLTKDTTTVGLGSLVKTKKTNYYIAISAGEFKEGSNIIYCISAVTPIGRLLIGKKEKQVFSFKGANIEILEVC